jgi:drug/metabolite transporter (DMT)-like permease
LKPLTKFNQLRGKLSPGVLYALAACFLFGSNAPFAKVLLQQISPPLLAALLNIGAALGLFMVFGWQRFQNTKTVINFPQGREWFWFLSTVVLGGVAAPILFIYGVDHSSAAAASLMLSFEGIATAAIAWVVFKERFHWLLAVAIAIILTGTIILNSSGAGQLSNPFATLAILTATLCWAMDNNLTRHISHRDPVMIALGKNLVAALVNGTIAISLGSNFPPLPWLFFACTLGVFSYGLSFTFLIMALRLLGASRTGAYFAITPFVGAGLSILLFREVLTLNFIIAALLIAVGVGLCIYEQLRHISK